jgi:hypothetical protein
MLPEEARTAHLFPTLGNTSLISIGQLCDVGCAAYFTAPEVEIIYEKRIILRGKRNDTT